jgi:hypothetical protein
MKCDLTSLNAPLDEVDESSLRPISQLGWHPLTAM